MIDLSACSAAKQPTDQAVDITQQVDNHTKSVPDNIADGGIMLGVRHPPPSFTRSIVNGITFYAGNYRLNNAGKLVVDFCFEQVHLMETGS